MELHVKHTLVRLFAVARDLLDACLGAKYVPKADGAVMATGY